MWTDLAAHARLVASSPSRCAMAWMPAGETQSGNDILLPRTLAEVSTLDTSRRTRGRSLYLAYELLFSLTVIWFVAPEL